ncbi:hypothetical protein C4J96_2022 [Pseudomonas orientalis]|nr:hypothetical protein C4J96_2022 [Pseudomonas orientalis]
MNKSPQAFLKVAATLECAPTFYVKQPAFEKFQKKPRSTTSG